MLNGRIKAILLVFALILSQAGMLVLTANVSAAEDNIVTPAAGGSFGGGDGSAANPYVIEDVWDLQNMSSNLSAHYILGNDIDASDTVNWNGGAGFMPVSDHTNQFTGSLDGRGHTIYNLHINRPSTNPVGIIGHLAPGGVIRNVNVRNGNITGGANRALLLGYNEGLVENCTVTGVINRGMTPQSSYSYAGGIVGRQLGAGASIINCTSDAVITGYSIVGGIVGENDDGNITRCRSYGRINGINGLGGIVGYGWNSYVSDSLNYAEINATELLIGGIIGSNGGSGVIQNCSNYADVRTGQDSQGRSYVGGVAGDNDGVIENSSSHGDIYGDGAGVGGLAGANWASGRISNCYATGNVYGISSAGLVSENEGMVNFSYSTGKVTDANSGLINSNTGTVNNSYWDMDSSGVNTSAAGIGKNNAEMHSRATFAGWDFGSRWMIAEGASYPILKWELPYLSLFVGGNGTPSDPYLISNVWELQNMSFYPNASYAIVNDIEAGITEGWNAGMGFMPVGNMTVPFNGSLDGRGYGILNITIDREGMDSVGLFGHISPDATAGNFSVMNASVSGRNDVGAVAGANAGNLSDIKVSGFLSGNVSVGAIAGNNTGEIYSCTAVSGERVMQAGSPVADWRMDESHWNGSAGEVLDSSGNGNDGTAFNGADTTSGKISRCGYFDGVNDYVQVPYNATLNPDNFTISVWAKVEGGSGTFRSVITSRDNFPGRGYIIYASADDNWSFWLGTGNSSTNWNGLTGPAVRMDEWTHVAAVYNGTYASLYVNGVLVNSSIASYSKNTAQPLRIGAGRSESSPLYFFNGSIDEMRIYDHALSDAEIRALAGNGVFGGSNVGGIAGYNSGNITVSSSSIAVHGNSGVGGMAGKNTGHVSRSTAGGNVSGVSSVGGISGVNRGSIELSVSSAAVSGNNEVGGIAGLNTYGTVSPDISSDLVVYWKLDESFWNGAAGEVLDSSGNGKDGTALNGANTTVGYHGRSGYFDGTDDYVAIPNDFGIFNGSYSITISAWIKPFDVRNAREIVSLQGENAWDYDIREDGNFYFGVYSAGGTSYDVAAPYTVGEWQHFVGVYNNTTGLKLYKNGVLVGSNPWTGAVATAARTSAIGAEPTFFNEYFKGLVDDVMIYNRSLNDSEISWLYGSSRGALIENCISNGTVSGDNGVGGAVGSNSAMVRDCYSTASVNGSGPDVGGFAGSNSGLVDACFWDNQTSGMTTGQGGDGRDTGEMKTRGTYASAGWDFEIVWYIRMDGTQYPVLIRDVEPVYVITDVYELDMMRLDLSGHYILANDIDAGITNGWDYIDGAYRGFVPIGTGTRGFTGSFDGQGHTIYNLYMDRRDSDNVSLFGSIGAGGAVSNLTLENINVTGHYYVGGMAGSSGGDMRNCTVSGSIDGYDYVGGLVGSNSGGIENCSTSGSVHGLDTYTGGAGGLVGENHGVINGSKSSSEVTAEYLPPHLSIYNYGGGFVGRNYGTISNSSASGSVLLVGDYAYGGGFVGENYYGTITDSSASGDVYNGVSDSGYIGGFAGLGLRIYRCFATGDVSGGYHTGGFAGLGYGLLMDSYSTGSVSGSRYVGGFAGSAYSGTTRCYSTGDVLALDAQDAGGFIGLLQSGEIKDSYSTGAVRGSGDNVGGFAGVLPSSTTITNCYSTGAVEATGTNVGGFIGTNFGTVTDSFWDVQTSGMSTSAGGTGKTTAEMMRQATFTNWNFTGVWSIHEGDTYPYLTALGMSTVTDMGVSMSVATAGLYNLGDIVQYVVNVTNHGQNIAFGVSVNLTLPSFVSWDSDNRSVGPPAGNYLQWDIGRMEPWTTMSWTVNLTAIAPGTGAVKVIVSADNPDNGPHANSDELALHVNAPPVANSDSATMAEDASAVSIDVLANDTDSDGDALTIISVSQGAHGSVAIINGESITYTPDANFNGFDSFNYTISDGNGATATAWVNITVLSVNDPPVITTSDILTATQDVLYSVDYNASDPDGDTLIWSLQTDAGWLSIDAATGVLSGTPANSDVGTYWVNVSVSDGNGGMDWHNFTLTVQNVNDPPVITTTDVTTATQDILYSVDYNATDIDGDTLTWSLQTDAAWLSMDGSHLWGTPANADVGTYWVNVSVSDGNGGTDYHNFTLTVQNVNDPPTITTDDITTATQDVLYSVDYTATDPDGDTLTWSLQTDAAWLSIDAATGVLSGTPTNSDVGTYRVNVSVSDGNGGIDYHNFTLTVQNVNDPPTITTTDVTTATQDILYSVDYSATDIDGDTLTWSLHTDAGWLSMDGSHLWGTPANADVGIYWVNVSVSDENGGLDWHNFTLTVQNVNDPPVISTSDITTATQDVLYSVDYTASDPDGDTLTWSLQTDAGWLSIDAATGVLSGTPLNEDVGTYRVNVSVSDGNGGIDYHNFTLTVQNVNDRPVIGSIDAPDGMVGENYTLLVSASDADGDALTWSLQTDVSWLSINASTGLITGVPDTAGNYSVSVTVSDGNGGSDTVRFNITVLSDRDGDGIPDDSDPYPDDTDNDGVNNTDDAYPLDPSRWNPPVEYHNETVYVNETVEVPIYETYLNDTDGDGIPDSWELLYGLDMNNSADASEDPDGDGISNLEEYLGGTSPRHPDTSSNVEEPSSASGDGLLLALLALLIGIGAGALFMAIFRRGKEKNYDDGMENIDEEGTDSEDETEEDTEEQPEEADEPDDI